MTVLCPRQTPAYWRWMIQRDGLPVADLGAGFGAGFGARVSTGGGVIFAPELPLSRAGCDELADAWRTGAAVVGSTAVARFLLEQPKGSFHRHRHHLLGITGGGALFSHCPGVRVLAPIDPVFESATIGRIWPSGDRAISIFQNAPAPIIALPLPRARDFVGRRGQLIPLEIGAGRYVTEFVSLTDHAALRRLVRNALAVASEWQGTPLMRRALAPAGFSAALAVRIDADGFNADATQATAKMLAAAGMRGSWFIDVERHERYAGADAVQQLAAEGHELGSHGYRHFTYRTAWANQRNLRRAADRLGAWRGDPSAFVAPFGEFHLGLWRAMRLSGVRWSSEFELLYDDPPGPVALTAAIINTPTAMQVPIHPICPKLLFDAGLDASDIGDYFQRVVWKQWSAGDPAVIYGHPINDLGLCPEWAEHLLNVVGRWEAQANGPVWRATLSDLHDAACNRHQRPAETPVLLSTSTIFDDPSDMPPTWAPSLIHSVAAHGRRLRWRRRLHDCRLSLMGPKK